MNRSAGARRFTQVDVFGAAPFRGNPVAVVHDADDLSDRECRDFARWTNLSETTFLSAPTDPQADYRVRILTPERELPFAGHPTLGTARAWLAAGGIPNGGDIVQECGIGLVRVRRTGDKLAFAAPEFVREGPVAPDDAARVVRSLGVRPDDIVELRWIDNGPGWIGVRLRDAAAVLALGAPTPAGLPSIGVVGAYPPGDPRRPADIEVRAFVVGERRYEDPVTGSLNAGIARWLIGAGVLPDRYVAAQGTALGRLGRVSVHRDGDGLWIAGATRVGIAGTVALP